LETDLTPLIKGDNKMNEELKKELEKIARRECWSDDEDFNPFEYSGGNYDDAYYGGVNDGIVSLARRLLKEFK